MASSGGGCSAAGRRRCVVGGRHMLLLLLATALRCGARERGRGGGVRRGAHTAGALASAGAAQARCHRDVACRFVPHQLPHLACSQEVQRVREWVPVQRRRRRPALGLASASAGRRRCAKHAHGGHHYTAKRVRPRAVLWRRARRVKRLQLPVALAQVAALEAARVNHGRLHPRRQRRQPARRHHVRTHGGRGLHRPQRAAAAAGSGSGS
eukprot:361505-Chlamydomonas_euryale.AAC.1